jgi:hypothetical protein
MLRAISKTETRMKKTDPYSTRKRGGHAASKPGLLSFRSNAFVDTFPEPDIRIHVPRVDETLEVVRDLNGQHDDIRSAVPLGHARGIETGESKTSEDAGALKDMTQIWVHRKPALDCKH